VKSALEEARGPTSSARRCALNSSCSMVSPRSLRRACQSLDYAGRHAARAGMRRADAREERFQPRLACARSPEQVARAAAATLRRQPWASGGQQRQRQGDARVRVAPSRRAPSRWARGAARGRDGMHAARAAAAAPKECTRARSPEQVRPEQTDASRRAARGALEPSSRRAPSWRASEQTRAERMHACA
jgi:hypothetical protein